MSDDSRLEGKIKRQITQFAGRLTDGWAKPLRRFVGEMLYGIQAAGLIRQALDSPASSPGAPGSFEMTPR